MRWICKYMANAFPPYHLQEATVLFESMIVSEGKRLQSEGKNGLVILPGVQNLIGTVSFSAFFDLHLMILP